MGVTRDVMSKLQEGMDLPAIRTFIDEKYGKAEGMNVPRPPAHGGH